MAAGASNEANAARIDCVAKSSHTCRVNSSRLGLKNQTLPAATVDNLISRVTEVVLLNSIHSHPAGALDFSHRISRMLKT